MTSLAPTLQKFFTDRLLTQRGASPHTVAAYRDTFRLLLGYVHRGTGISPAKLGFADLDASVVAGFLSYLEVERHNSVRTRNARLAAIHSFYEYAALEHPEHAEVIQRVLAIPAKRHDKAIVTFLTAVELDALIAAVDTSSWLGRRDHALIVTAAQTGLRVGELTALSLERTHLGVGAHVTCLGKGRKHRAVPLTATTVEVLRRWLGERGGDPTDPVFPTRKGTPLSQDAVAKLLHKHLDRAIETAPSLRAKAVTPHTLRHTAAMRLLHAGVDVSVIALWLGHESVETTGIYLHADMTLKQKAVDRTTPPRVQPGRYRPPDALMAFLEAI